MAHLTIYLADTWAETLNRILKAGAPCSNSDFDWIYAQWERYVQEHPPIPPPPPPPRFHETLWREISPTPSNSVPISTPGLELGGFERSGKQELPQTLTEIQAYTYGREDWLRLMELHRTDLPILTYLIQTDPASWRQCSHRILKWELEPEVQAFLERRAPAQSRKGIKAKARRRHRK